MSYYAPENTVLGCLDVSTFQTSLQGFFLNKLSKLMKRLKSCPILTQLNKDQLNTLLMRAELVKMNDEGVFVAQDKLEYLYFPLKGEHYLIQQLKEE